MGQAQFGSATLPEQYETHSTDPVQCQGGETFKHSPPCQELVVQIQVLSSDCSQAQFRGSRAQATGGEPGGWAAAPGKTLTLLCGGEAASCCCFAMFSDKHQHTLFFCSCECASKVNKHSAF